MQTKKETNTLDPLSDFDMKSSTEGFLLKINIKYTFHI